MSALGHAVGAEAAAVIFEHRKMTKECPLAEVLHGQAGGLVQHRGHGGAGFLDMPELGRDRSQ